jgi:hypothetical protein
MSLIPVEGHNGLYRDHISGAIVNCSDKDFDAYLTMKQNKISDKKEIESLKNEVSEIKDIMKLILSKLDSNS